MAVDACELSIRLGLLKKHMQQTYVFLCIVKLIAIVLFWYFNFDMLFARIIRSVKY